MANSLMPHKYKYDPLPPLESFEGFIERKHTESEIVEYLDKWRDQLRRAWNKRG